MFNHIVPAQEPFMSIATQVHIPTHGNEKLEHFLNLVNADEELIQIWQCVNMNAVYRSGMSDHGYVHVQIAANAASKILRLLLDGGIVPSIVSDYRLSEEDSAVVVVGGCLLHDIGMCVQRENHEIYGVALASEVLPRLLGPIYGMRERIIITSEILHSIIAHQWEETCLTIEAGVVKVADALDMTHGRSRIPFEAGEINIHSVSAASIDSVHIKAGTNKPVHVDIVLRNYAGIYQVDELLKPKLLGSSIAPYVEVCASIRGEPGHDLGVVYSL
jgi:metal-dependent HD superfamily phosphatase/phosphodiesterase